MYVTQSRMKMRRKGSQEHAALFSQNIFLATRMEHPTIVMSPSPKQRSALPLHPSLSIHPPEVA